DTIFSPDATMIRAQFAAIMVGALNLPAQPVAVFGDISPSAWYASYVGTAYTQGIVKGISAASFNPAGTITREEAAAMVTRAAKLCGMDVAVHDMAIRDMLAQFGDYTKISDWARGSLAFCYRENILDQKALNIQPQVAIKRCEIAQMVYNMLVAASLL
ncbi:MAG: S-layer homology domain-containing protein, partial [Clostridiales bacterium]